LVEVNEKEGAVTFKVRAQPRAAKSEIVGAYGDALKVRLAAPPVDGKANEECRKFFAKLFQVPVNSVEIVVGDLARDKIIRIHNISKTRVVEKLSAFIPHQ
jgi:uncharacterized protein (TIGR00251 family)